jgi:methionyl-tRNA formyltransferase
LSAGTAARAGNGQLRRLRTVFCTRGGLFGALVLQSLLACDRIELCGIVRSARWLDPALGLFRGSLAYIRRSGVAYSLYLWCATTLADALLALAGIQRVPTRALKPGVPVHTTRDINDRDGLKFLGDCAPDLLVSAFFDQRLGEQALALPARGCLNIHPSLLPWFKGVDPVLQATLTAARTGVSVHYMTTELDAGTILAQQAVDMGGRASIFGATALLFRAGAELLVGVIDRVARGEAGTPQDRSGSYQSWPSRADVRALRRRGGALIRLSDLQGIFSAPRTGSHTIGGIPR